MFGDCDVQGITFEEGDASEHFVGNAAHGVKIGRRRHGFASELFRSHIFGCADEFIFGIIVLIGSNFSDAEVEDFDEVVVVTDAGDEHDICGFKVTVNEADGMGFLQGGEDLCEDVNDALRLQDGLFFEQGFEWFPDDELHDEVGEAVGSFSCIVEEYGINSAELSQDLAFAFEAFELSGLIEAFSGEDFDGDFSLEIEVEGFVDDAAAAASDEFQELVTFVQD